MDKAVKAIVANLKTQSQNVGDNNKKIEQVATISANNDNTIVSLLKQWKKKKKGSLLKKPREQKQLLKL